MWGPLWCQWLDSLGAYMPIDFVLVLNNIVGPRDLLLPPAMLGAAPGNSVVLQILVGREGLSLCLSLPWFPAWPRGNASVSSLPSAYRLCLWPASTLAVPSDLPAAALPCHQPGCSLAGYSPHISLRPAKAFWALQSLDPAGSPRDSQK